MGRHRTIDRDAILDLAEEIIIGKGAAALTISAVAEAAGISKGGVQSSFGTKEALVRAMLERWFEKENQGFRAELGEREGVTDRVEAHAKLTHLSHDANERAAGLLVALLQSPRYLDTTREWYAKRMAGLDAESPEARRAQLAFFAIEGAFYLRYFGLCKMDETQWNRIFGDVAKLIADSRFP